MKKSLQFLSDLQQNNNREWFQANKPIYEECHQEAISFADSLLLEMNKHDVIETSTGKKSLNRIYRDVRFSKNKLPYKNHWGGGFKRSGHDRRGGYYYHIGPEDSFVMGGFFGPNAQDLLHIRKQLAQYPDPLRDVLNSDKFKNFFGKMMGDQLKTAPKGFDKEHPDIDLLRYKQFMVRHDFQTDEVLKNDFHITVSQAFEEMRPFFDCMTEYLTTDMNGESLLS